MIFVLAGHLNYFARMFLLRGFVKKKSLLWEFRDQNLLDLLVYKPFMELLAFWIGKNRNFFLQSFRAFFYLVLDCHDFELWERNFCNLKDNNCKIKNNDILEHNFTILWSWKAFFVFTEICNSESFLEKERWIKPLVLNFLQKKNIFRFFFYFWM